MNPEGRGTLFVVGLGPGSPGLLTPDAAAALEAADTVVGYHGYLDLIADRLAGKQVIGRELGEEVERAREALEQAESGHTVALVSSGDAGVYGMGGVVWELVAQRGKSAEIVEVPGVTAALASSALLGAPLAHDWTCISLSDRLTPWDEIVRRIDAAARADFVIVFYNPTSQARTWQLAEAAWRLLSFRPPDTPVGLVENAYRPGQRVEIVRLDELAGAEVSMSTTVIVGSSRTIAAAGHLVTPRIYAAKHSGFQAAERGQARPGMPSKVGERIMAESLAIIDRELGPKPQERAERSVVTRMIHATADFEFASSLHSSPGALAAVIAAFRRGATVVVDVAMLREGIRRDLSRPLGVSVDCGLGDPEVERLADLEGATRAAIGIRLAAGRTGDGAVVAVGNAPTALVETLRMVETGAWRPAAVIGIPVGFIGVEEAKRRLIEQDRVPFVTCLGRKGGTAVTAAAVNALLELAGHARPP